jgi:hypothetical protein
VLVLLLLVLEVGLLCWWLGCFLLCAGVWVIWWLGAGVGG